MSYQSKNQGLLTQSKIKDFLTCEQLYKLLYVEGVPMAEEKNNFMLFGTAFDLLGTDEEEYQKRFEVCKMRTEKKLQEAEERGVSLITELQSKQLSSALKETKRAPLHSDKTGFDSQYQIQVEYNGFTLGGTLDWFSLEKEQIIDTKTTGSIATFMRDAEALDRYKFQLAYYQFLVELKHDVLCDGILEFVTREMPSKSIYLKATRESLRMKRKQIVDCIDRIKLVSDLDIFLPATRTTCLSCKAYAVCEFSKQLEFIEI